MRYPEIGDRPQKVLSHPKIGIPIAWYKSRIPGFPQKSIREGASSLFGRGPESPKNVSCSRATPRLHRCKSGLLYEKVHTMFSRGPALFSISTERHLLALYACKLYLTKAPVLRRCKGKLSTGSTMTRACPALVPPPFYAKEACGKWSGPSA